MKQEIMFKINGEYKNAGELSTTDMLNERNRLDGGEGKVFNDGDFVVYQKKNGCEIRMFNTDKTKDLFTRIQKQDVKPKKVKVTITKERVIKRFGLPPKRKKF